MNNSNHEILRQLLADPTMKVDPAWCDAMSREYPYFTLPAALELERNGNLPENAARRKELSQRIALNSASPEMLYRLTEPMGKAQCNFYPPEEPKEPTTTEAVIDTFINNYGGGSDSHETELLEKLIFNPAPDYAQLLSDEEERSLPDQADPDDSQDSRINSFILKSRERHGHFPPAVPETPEPQPSPAKKETIQEPASQDDTLLSESLAKIYIKQRRYSKAYEIISNLSLKYPEKSIYFADQLRFLHKLVINQKYIKQK